MRTMGPWLVLISLCLVDAIAMGADQSPGTTLAPTAPPVDGPGVRDGAAQLTQAPAGPASPPPAPARPASPALRGPSAPAAVPPPAQPRPAPAAVPPPAQPRPGPMSSPTPAGNAFAAATIAAPTGGGFGASMGGFGTLAGTTVGGIPQMIGDQGPFSLRQAASLPQPPSVPPPFPPKQPPKLPNPKTRSLLVPSVRGFKIADNQSPYPQDRFFVSFNYFDNVNARLNRFFQSPIDNVSVFRYIYGAEKTFNQGMGSVGLLLPLNSVHAATRAGLVNQGGTSTALGDLTVFAKYVMAYNPLTGDLVSAGFAVTPPTGPPSFANAPFLA